MEYEYQNKRDDYQSDSIVSSNEEDEEVSILKSILNSVKSGGGIITTPAANERGVYFGCNDSYFYALDHSGNLRWKFLTGGPIGYPSVGNKMVLFGSFDGYFYALDENTGELLWKFKANGRFLDCPALYPDTIYIGNEDGNMYAFSYSGEKLWSYKVSVGIFSTPTKVNDKIYFAGLDKNLYCLSEEGTLLWKYPTGSIVFSPYIVDSTGNQITKFRDLNKNIYIKSGCVLFSSNDGHLHCLDLEGILLWKIKTEKKLSGLNIVNGVIYSGCYTSDFYAIYLKDGFTKWKIPIKSYLTSDPVFYNNVVYFNCVENMVYAVDYKSGNILWTFKTNGALTAGPFLYNDILYLGSWDSNIYAIDIKKKELIWKFQTGFGPQKPLFSGLMSKFVDLKSKFRRFWRPDPKPQNPIYEKEPLKESVNKYSMDSPYSSKPDSYTMDSPYNSRKKERKF